MPLYTTNAQHNPWGQRAARKLRGARHSSFRSHRTAGKGRALRGLVPIHAKYQPFHPPQPSSNSWHTALMKVSSGRCPFTVFTTLGPALIPSSSPNRTMIVHPNGAVLERPQSRVSPRGKLGYRPCRSWRRPQSAVTKSKLQSLSMSGEPTNCHSYKALHTKHE